METITQSPPTRLRDLLPSATRPNHGTTRLRSLVHAEPELRLTWFANHLDEHEPIRGGRKEVRLLVYAIDGEAWPFTIIENLDTGRWFQVLGSSTECVLELGIGPTVRMVARRTNNRTASKLLAPECRYWVPYARTSELHTAFDAAHLGLRHMQGFDLPYGFELRTVHSPDHHRVQ